MTLLEVILTGIALTALGLLVVGVKVLRVLGEIKTRQAAVTASMPKAFAEKLDELYGVKAMLERADLLRQSVQTISGEDHSIEMVRASVRIAQTTYTTLTKQTAEAMIVTRLKLSGYEELHAHRGHYESEMKRCRLLLNEQREAHASLLEMQQQLLGLEENLAD